MTRTQTLRAWLVLTAAALLTPTVLAVLHLAVTR